MPAEQLGGLTPTARLRRTPAGPGSPALALGAGCLWGHPLTAAVLAAGGPAEGCPGGGWVSPCVRRRPGSPFLPPQVLEGAALSARRERGGAGRRCCLSRVPSAPSGAGGCRIGPWAGDGELRRCPQPSLAPAQAAAASPLAGNWRGTGAAGARAAAPGPAHRGPAIPAGVGALPRGERQRQSVCLCGCLEWRVWGD